MANSILQLLFASALLLHFLGLVLQTVAHMCRVCVSVCACEHVDLCLFLHACVRPKLEDVCPVLSHLESK